MYCAISRSCRKTTVASASFGNIYDWAEAPTWPSLHAEMPTLNWCLLLGEDKWTVQQWQRDERSSPINLSFPPFPRVHDESLHVERFLWENNESHAFSQPLLTSAVFTCSGTESDVKGRGQEERNDVIYVESWPIKQLLPLCHKCEPQVFANVCSSNVHGLLLRPQVHPRCEEVCF